MKKHLTGKREDKLFQCPECGLQYKAKEWAEKCKVWCKKYKTCNVGITSHAAENQRLG